MKEISLAPLIVLLALAGCDGGNAADAPSTPAPPEHPPTISNRIELPESVRQNLGITFAKVESRRVAATVRVPGTFELLPSARREYHSILPARVELLVRQYQQVKEGDLLARLDSPEWRRIQHEAIEAEGEIKVAQAQLDVAAATLSENETAVRLLDERVAALAEANVRRAELETEATLARSRIARLNAEVRAAEVKLAEAREHYASKLNTLASVVGIPVKQLTAASGTGEGDAPAEPLWRTLGTVEVRASQPGVVETLGVTSGGWVEAGGALLSTVDLTQLRFRAVTLQADLPRLKEIVSARIVPPAGANGETDAIPATAHLGLEASADTRTIDLILLPEKLAPWTRPGVSAYAEIVTDASAEAEPAIPVAAVVQDELAMIYFRRDPKDPDKVIRVEGDFGISDGKWITVRSGLKAGDEVVLDGVYELKLTGTGKAQAGGHFHADGTWHAEGTPEPREN